MATIRSRSHPLVKQIRALRDARQRSESGLYLIEGVKILLDALDAAVTLVDVVVSERLDRDDLGRLCRQRLTTSATRVHVAPDAILGHLATTVTHQGVVAVAPRQPRTMTTILVPDRHPLVVIAVGIQDPGNLGALIRTAEALDASALVSCGDGVDPWGPKVIRGASGSSFRLPIGVATTPREVVAAATAAGYRTVAAVARDGNDPSPSSLASPVALFLGSEGHGLPEDLLQGMDLRVRIPLRPPVESLNVAVAAAVLLFARQPRPS